MNPTGSDEMTSLYDILKANRLGMNHDYWVAMLGKTWKASKEKYKEYTGLVPYTFKANGEPLLDWRINGNTGGVGDKTANLVPAITDNSWVPGWLDGGIVKPATSYKEKTSDFIELSGDLQSITVYSPDGFPYTSSVTPWVRLGFFDADNNYLSQSTAAGNVLSQGFYTFNIIPENSVKVRLSCRTFEENFRIMLNVGGIQDFEPYGFKIPIICGGTVTNVYTDNPLGMQETIDMETTGVEISTIAGNNTLEIGTVIQPSSVYIKYKE